MQPVFGIPWVLLLIRSVLILIIPVLVLLVPSEGGSAGYALWWSGIMCLALFIIHWRDWLVSTVQGATVYLGGVIMCLILCYAAWFLGVWFWGTPGAVFDTAYPSVSAGINEILLAFYIAAACVHAVIEAVIFRARR